MAEVIRENVALLQSLVADGYGDRDCLLRRIAAMEASTLSPAARRPCRIPAVLDIELTALTEPLLACPNAPDDVQPLSEVAGAPIDEAFIGSCMTHRSHLQAAACLLAGEPYAAARLWMARSAA